MLPKPSLTVKTLSGMASLSNGPIIDYVATVVLMLV